MSNHMHLIMENWNRAILREQLINNKDYVEKVLGLSFTLTESNRSVVLQEQLLLEAFFDKWRDLAGGLQSLFKAVGDLVSNENKIGSYMAFIEKGISERITAIRNFLDKIISTINNQIVTDLIEKFKALVNTVIQQYVDLPDNWRKGLIGLGLMVTANKAIETLESFDPAAIAKDAGSDAVVNEIKSQLLDQLTSFIGEEALSALTSFLDGGVTMFARKLQQLVGTANDILEPLKPVLDLIKKGGLSLFKRGSENLTLQEMMI